MGTFSAGCSLLVTNFLEYIPPLVIWPFWNPIPNVVSVSNRVILRKLEGGQKERWKGEGSYTNFDNFVGELGRKAWSVGLNSNNFLLDKSNWTVLVLDNLSRLFSFMNLRLTFENDDDYSKTTFTSYLWFSIFCLKKPLSFNPAIYLGLFTI